MLYFIIVFVSPIVAVEIYYDNYDIIMFQFVGGGGGGGTQCAPPHPPLYETLIAILLHTLLVYRSHTLNCVGTDDLHIDL